MKKSFIILFLLTSISVCAEERLVSRLSVNVTSSIPLDYNVTEFTAPTAGVYSFEYISGWHNPWGQDGSDPEAPNYYEINLSTGQTCGKDSNCQVTLTEGQTIKIGTQDTFPYDNSGENYTIEIYGDVNDCILDAKILYKYTNLTPPDTPGNYKFKCDILIHTTIKDSTGKEVQAIEDPNASGTFEAANAEFAKCVAKFFAQNQFFGSVNTRKYTVNASQTTNCDVPNREFTFNRKDDCEPGGCSNPMGANSGEAFSNGFDSCMSCPSKGGPTTLGGHYHVALANVSSTMGLGFRNDFDITAGRMGTTGNLSYIVFMNGKRVSFHDNNSTEILETDDKNNNGEILDLDDNGTDDTLRVKIGKTAYEFDLPTVNGNSGLKPVKTATQIIFESREDGVNTYKGPVLTFTYDANNRLEKVENETGEFYTFNYVNGLLSSITNHNNETQRSFGYTNNRLTSRYQIGLGDTTFSYTTVNGVTLLTTETRYDGSIISYDWVGAVAVTDYFDSTKQLVLARYNYDENTYSGPQTIKTYTYVDNMGGSYTTYQRPLWDDNGTIVYATSKEYDPVIVTHATYGSVIKNITENENSSTTTSYSGPAGMLWSQTVGTDATVTTTVNEYDSKGNLSKTATRNLSTIPPNTWDIEYEYDRVGRVIKTTRLDGVSHHVDYVGESTVSDSRKSAEWDEKNSVEFNKVTYEYYASTEPAYRRYKLKNKIRHLDATTTYTTIHDYIQTDNDNPQNVGKLWKRTYPDNSYEQFSYGCCDVLTYTDRKGGAVTTTLRDAAGRVTSKTEPSGAITGYAYYPTGKLNTITLPAGGVLTHTYNPQGRLQSISYPDGTSMSKTYRVDGQIETETSRSGLVTTYHYFDSDGPKDGSLKKISTADSDPDTPDGDIQQYTYDGLGRTATTTNEKGLVLTLNYDDFGNQNKTVWPDSTFTENVYNSSTGLLSSSRTRRAKITNYEYDNLGRVDTVVLPNGLRKETVFDDLSRVDYTVLNDGTTSLTTDYTWDGADNLKEIEYPDSTTISGTYANGVLSELIDKAGTKWIPVFSNGMYKSITPEGATEPYFNITLKTNGQLNTYTGPNGKTITYTTYDNMGRATKITLDDTSFFEKEFGVFGPTANIDRGSRRTEIVYDAYGRVKNITDPENNVKTYGYDLAGNMTSLTYKQDTADIATQWGYDTESRLTSKTYADSSGYAYTYYADGLLKTRTDAKNKTTTYTYNDIGLLTDIEYPNDTDVSYVWNKFGNITSMTDASGTTNWGYDALKRLTSENGPFANNDTVSYTPDTAGRKGTMTANGITFTYGYDSISRLQTITPSASLPVFAYSYLGLSKQTDTIKRGTNTVVDNDFDNIGRLDFKANKNLAGNVINSYDYTINDSDERTKVTFVDGKFIDYGYDDTGQLETAQRKFADDSVDYAYSYGFAYDKIGNPTSRTSSGQVKTYSFNDLNQFDANTATAPIATDVVGKINPSATAPFTVTVNGQAATVDSSGNFVKQGVALTTGQNSISIQTTDKHSRQKSKTLNINVAAAPVFSYDPNGNMTSDGTWTFSWNEENRLVSAIKTDDTKVEFVYDGMGRRRVKKVYSWVASAWSLTSETRFVYDGNNLVAELDGSNTVQKTHTWGLDLTGSLTASGGVGALLATNDGTTINFPYYDANGNITAYIDSSDNVTYSCTYSPFGKAIEETGTKPASFGFSTKPYDTETGMNYYRFRYYNPNLGRWINRDPIEEEVGGENLYAMVYNNAVKYWDYLGLFNREAYCKKLCLVIKNTKDQVQHNGDMVNLLGNVLKGQGELGATSQVLDYWSSGLSIFTGAAGIAKAGSAAFANAFAKGGYAAIKRTFISYGGRTAAQEAARQAMIKQGAKEFSMSAATFAGGQIGASFDLGPGGAKNTYNDIKKYMDAINNESEKLLDRHKKLNKQAKRYCCECEK